MRIGSTTIPISQALTLTAPRPVTPEEPQREKYEPQRRAQTAAPTAGTRPDARIRAAALTPGVTIRGQRAVEAYTQHDLHERRAQYSALLGVDTYA